MYNFVPTKSVCTADGDVSKKSCLPAHTLHMRIALVYRVAYFIFTQIYHNVQFVLILIFKMRQRKKEEEEEEDGNFIWLRWLHAITYLHIYTAWWFGMYGKVRRLYCRYKCDVCSDTRSYFTGCFHSIRYTHRICKRNENYIHSITLLLHALNQQHLRNFVTASSFKRQ